MPARTKIRCDLYSPDALRRMARNERVPRRAKRLLAIAHAMEGMTFTAAAAAVGMERQALGDAVKRYNDEGLDGLNDRAKSGRRPKLDDAQIAELTMFVVAGPDPEIESVCAYTLSDVQTIIANRFGVTYNANYIGQLLSRLGFSHQKPRPYHPKKNVAAQAVFKGAWCTAQGGC